ncbi:MAG: Uma2 family endonuclease [Gomphosphaeria aponina SAG 52.96 = DSM 107014]|uniref:Uma2 family endonuclease n=1 Tax=Gomphosphaeria aponina SAG 52.96 = DSM 107014 TaxID=1521640 RepID=A0A941GSL6_9CHRO|nr:Uma2 family endonuclease [Gomphosphaeria aponina SAG 52.96 = DSM 107014]
MVSQLQTQTQPEVIYPDSDGKPMANNTKQFRQIVALKENLEWLYADEPNVFIAGDLFWYPIEGSNTVVNAPDVMVVFGRPKGDRLSYKQWEEGDIAPQVVFEILSPSNSQKEMDRKLLFYDRHGVEEYYIYNPDNNQLLGWLRNEYGLDAIESMVNWVSPRLGIRFELSEDSLQFYRPDGTRFFSDFEIRQLLEQREQQLEQKEQQLEQKEQELEQERQRTKEMEDLLKQYRDRFGELPNS